MTVKEFLEEESKIKGNYFTTAVIYTEDQNYWSEGEYFHVNSYKPETFVNENKENLFEKYGDCETDDQFFNVWDADDGPEPEDAWVFIRIKKS